MYAADGFRVDTTSHPKPATTRAVHMVAVDNSDGDAADTTAHRTQAIGQGPERLLSWLPSLPQGNRHSSAGSERWLPLPSSRSRAVPQWRIGIDRLSGGTNEPRGHTTREGTVERTQTSRPGVAKRFGGCALGVERFR